MTHAAADPISTSQTPSNTNNPPPSRHTLPRTPTQLGHPPSPALSPIPYPQSTKRTPQPKNGPWQPARQSAREDPQRASWPGILQTLSSPPIPPQHPSQYHETNPRSPVQKKKNTLSGTEQQRVRDKEAEIMRQKQEAGTVKHLLKSGILPLTMALYYGD
jgi:hypothetical protein